MNGTLFWISVVAIGTFVCLVLAQQNETIAERNGKGMNNFKFLLGQNSAFLLLFKSDFFQFSRSSRFFSSRTQDAEARAL
jgi:hypothetical protein